MRRLNGVLIEDITDENIVSKPVAERLRAYNENAKLWKVAFIAFLIAFGVNVLLTTFVLDKMVDGTLSARIRVFAVSFMSISFLAFAYFYIRERNFKKKKWNCPSCKEKYPYFVGEKECMGKSFIMDCNTLGVRLAKVEGSPFVLPHKCPNCNERMWKELSND